MQLTQLHYNNECHTGYQLALPLSLEGLIIPMICG